MRVFGALIALALVSQTGCSALSGFHRDWRSCCCASQGDITGYWDGCWESRCTGHHGKVRAIITRCDDTHYRARFHGTFFKVIPFGYEMTLTAVPQEGRYVLSGQRISAAWREAFIAFKATPPTASFTPITPATTTAARLS